MVIEIVPATLRDMCFIGANMRPQDRKEALATVDVPTGRDAAVLCFMASCEGWRWVALLNGQPVCAFGVTARSEYQPQIRQAWAFGTTQMRRVVPRVSRAAAATWPQWLLDEGANRLEAYSMAEHAQAHHWLEKMGAQLESIQEKRGVNGEDFHLYVWKRR